MQLRPRRIMIVRCDVTYIVQIQSFVLTIVTLIQWQNQLKVIHEGQYVWPTGSQAKPAAYRPTTWRLCLCKSGSCFEEEQMVELESFCSWDESGLQLIQLSGLGDKEILDIAR